MVLFTIICAIGLLLQNAIVSYLANLFLILGFSMFQCSSVFHCWIWESLAACGSVFHYWIWESLAACASVFHYWIWESLAACTSVFHYWFWESLAACASVLLYWIWLQATDIENLHLICTLVVQIIYLPHSLWIIAVSGSTYLHFKDYIKE